LEANWLLGIAFGNGAAITATVPTGAGWKNWIPRTREAEFSSGIDQKPYDGLFSMSRGVSPKERSPSIGTPGRFVYNPSWSYDANKPVCLSAGLETYTQVGAPRIHCKTS